MAVPEGPREDQIVDGERQVEEQVGVDAEDSGQRENTLNRDDPSLDDGEEDGEEEEHWHDPDRWHDNDR